MKIGVPAGRGNHGWQVGPIVMSERKKMECLGSRSMFLLTKLSFLEIFLYILFMQAMSLYTMGHTATIRN